TGAISNRGSARAKPEGQERGTNAARNRQESAAALSGARLRGRRPRVCRSERQYCAAREGAERQWRHRLALFQAEGRILLALQQAVRSGTTLKRKRLIIAVPNRKGDSYVSSTQESMPPDDSRITYFRRASAARP